MFSLKTQEVDCCEPKIRAEGRSSGMCAIIITTAAAAAAATAAVRHSDKTQRENPALLGWWYTVGAPVCVRVMYLISGTLPRWLHTHTPVLK